MSKQDLHTLSTAWVTTWSEDYNGFRTYTHVCPLCRYFYKDENEAGHTVCPSCRSGLI